MTKTYEQFCEEVNKEIQAAKAAGTMTKVELALNGGMDGEEAAELFQELSTEEVLEVLECDLAEGTECLVYADYPFINLKQSYYDIRSIKLDKENKIITITTDENNKDRKLVIRFTTADVYPDVDYNTKEYGAGNYSDSKEYDLLTYSSTGTFEGAITIII